MNIFQRLVTSFVPRSWAEQMEAESRAWIVRCSQCGNERSVWDAGGIRWKASGRPRRLMRCPRCSKWAWHTIERR